MASAIQKSFKPHPEVVEITEVHDVKEWMCPHTPPLHDHLKAHQFKFIRNPQGKTKMFYKEWSTDPFWLPQSGISLLVDSNSSFLPSGKPQIIQPLFDAADIEKLTSMLQKLSAYLEKSGAAAWWDVWLTTARQHTGGSPILQRTG